MNDIRKTIGWADLSWNPIKGKCPVGCWYCYAWKIYKRFKWPSGIRIDVRELYEPTTKKIEAGTRVFVCSTFELFHPVADEVRDAVFSVIEHRPDLTFIILTKLPERIDRPMPDNVWLGVTVESAKEWHRARTLACFTGAKKKFISFEPMLGPVDEEEFPYVAGEFDWFIIGRLTGHGKKNDPKWEMLLRILEVADEFGRPVFMKDNLKGIWRGAKLIQGFPR